MANKALDAATKARKVVSVAEKTVAIAEAVAQKKKLSVILHKTADAMVSAGEVSGNKKLQEVAGHVKDGAHIVDKAIVHAEEAHKIVKDTHKAIKKGDIKGIVKQVEKGIKKGKQIEKFVKEKGKTKVVVKSTPKTKAKRAPSKYNLFVSKKRKEGLTLKQISPLWKAEKLKN
jgi:hypothetical protein